MSLTDTFRRLLTPMRALTPFPAAARRGAPSTPGVSQHTGLRLFIFAPCAPTRALLTPTSRIHAWAEMRTALFPNLALKLSEPDFSSVTARGCILNLSNQGCEKLMRAAKCDLARLPMAMMYHPFALTLELELITAGWVMAPQSRAIHRLPMLYLHADGSGCRLNFAAEHVPTGANSGQSLYSLADAPVLTSLETTLPNDDLTNDMTARRDEFRNLQRTLCSALPCI